jgi:hypothetical protein
MSRDDMTMKSTKPQFGYFLLADISGFSSYLAGVELEHAGGVLQKLLEGISQKVKPVFRVQGFDIDSVFAFTPEAGITHFEKLYELVEHAYFEFKSNLAEISDHITCNCAACRDVTSLDLKFMVHFGEYILSSVQEKQILYGVDPTFVRNRGWKEAVSASVGWRGYALFTEPCLESLRVDTGKFRGKKFDHDHFTMIGIELGSRNA